MNYLSVFGMDGTSISQQGGSYTLNGVQAGTAFGTMGNTGISGAPHVDFGISSLVNSNIDFTDVFSFPKYNSESQYSSLYIKPWAEQFSGLEKRNWQDHEYVRDYMLNVYRQQYSPIWQMMKMMY